MLFLFSDGLLLLMMQIYLLRLVDSSRYLVNCVALLILSTKQLMEIASVLLRILKWRNERSEGLNHVIGWNYLSWSSRSSIIT
jgi:hypothetical protein